MHCSVVVKDELELTLLELVPKDALPLNPMYLPLMLAISDFADEELLVEIRMIEIHDAPCVNPRA